MRECECGIQQWNGQVTGVTAKEPSVVQPRSDGYRRTPVEGVLTALTPVISHTSIVTGF